MVRKEIDPLTEPMPRRLTKLSWVAGKDLSAGQREAALALFPDRHTVETPCARLQRAGAALTFETDGEWLDASLFAVGPGGVLDREIACVTRSPTYPRNPELWGPEQQAAAAKARRAASPKPKPDVPRHHPARIRIKKPSQGS